MNLITCEIESRKLVFVCSLENKEIWMWHTNKGIYKITSRISDACSALSSVSVLTRAHQDSLSL